MRGLYQGIGCQHKSFIITKGIFGKQVLDPWSWIQVNGDGDIRTVVTVFTHMVWPVIPDPCSKAVGDDLNTVGIVNKQIGNINKIRFFTITCYTSRSTAPGV